MLDHSVRLVGEWKLTKVYNFQSLIFIIQRKHSVIVISSYSYIASAYQWQCTHLSARMMYMSITCHPARKSRWRSQAGSSRSLLESWTDTQGATVPMSAYINLYTFTRIDT